MAYQDPRKESKVNAIAIEHDDRDSATHFLDTGPDIDLELLLNLAINTPLRRTQLSTYT